MQENDSLENKNFEIEENLSEMDNPLVQSEPLENEPPRSTDEELFVEETEIPEVLPSEDATDTDSSGTDCSIGIEMIRELKSLVLNLAKDFETKLKYDATKQQQVDKLYDENRQHKDGIVRKFRDSMILAVIEQIDGAAKQIAHFENVEFSEDNFRKILASYRDIALCLQDMLLEKFDVENYTCTPGDQFDPKRQRSLKTVRTDEIEKNKTVVKSLRAGYRTNEGQILRPELVEVYVYDKSLDETE